MLAIPSSLTISGKLQFSLLHSLMKDHKTKESNSVGNNIKKERIETLKMRLFLMSKKKFVFLCN